MHLPASNKTRAAFTLVELLVVIAIIAVLVSLLSAGIYYAVINATAARNANDINQLSIALENFKVKFGCYPPSRIRLVESMVLYNNPSIPNPVLGTVSTPFYNVTVVNGQPVNYLDYYSVAVLRQMWPRLSWTTWPTLPTGNTAVDWNGDSIIYYNELLIGDFTLEGDQCLVFFLGGIPNPFPPGPAGTIGFSSNPVNPSPTSPANTATTSGQVFGQMIGPFYTFPPNRLVLLHPSINPTQFPNNFYSFLDVYGTTSNPASKPFAYFSAARGQKNKYNPGWHPTTSLTSDCQTIGAMPYCQPVPVSLASSVPAMYVNPDSYQIISAGSDQQFGSQVPQTPIAGYYGVIWNASSSPATFSVGTNFNPFPQILPNGHAGAVTAGADDRTNFCPNILSAGNAN